MCGSGRLETSCHSRAMMAGLRKRGRGGFAEKTAKLQKKSPAVSLRGTARCRCPHYLNRFTLKCRAWATKALSCGSPRACVAEALPLVPSVSLMLASAACAAHVSGEYGLILRGRRRSPCRALPVNRRRRRAGFCGIAKNAMRRYSSIESPRNGVGIRNSQSAIGIGKLECVQMQIVQRLPIIAARCAQ